ncbi:MAG: ribonucleoside-diphosphate reductase [Pseudomonadota bacterium]
MHRIDQPIIAFRRSDSAAGAGAPAGDDNPLGKRIPSRPEGELESVTEKVRYWTQEGPQTVYLVVSFVAVSGTVDGERVTIERPIEFFLPTGQHSESYQWISATMRSLSLAARGGYATRALRDLRKVTWDRGPVRCGTNEYGKPLYHPSEVAAIAHALQQILQRRGFLAPDGQPRPLRELAATFRDKEQSPRRAVIRSLEPPQSALVSTPACPQCGSQLEVIDGCPTCRDCGYSRC